MPKKILIASSAFYPENSPRSFRATELAKEFARIGHDVSVLTIGRGEPLVMFCRIHNLKLKVIDRLRFGNVSKSTGFLGLFKRLIMRSLLYAFEYPDVELALRFGSALKEERGLDLLISVAVPYPVHWGVAWVMRPSRRISKCWIADCGDPYMGNQSDSFGHPFYFAAVEKWMFRKTDFISIPIESARSAYFNEFHNKIVVIPQGANFSYLQQHVRPYFRNRIPRFAYSGTFIPQKRDPTYLFEYLLTLEVDFEFWIYSQAQPWIRNFVERSAGRIRLLPYVSREELISELSQMDFLVNVENSTSTQAPSKLLDYYIAGRPVLSVYSTQTEFPAVKKFLNYNFDDAIDLSHLESYRIENVVSSFLAIAH